VSDTAGQSTDGHAKRRSVNPFGAQAGQTANDPLGLDKLQEEGDGHVSDIAGQSTDGHAKRRSVNPFGAQAGQAANDPLGLDKLQEEGDGHVSDIAGQSTDGHAKRRSVNPFGAQARQDQQSHTSDKQEPGNPRARRESSGTRRNSVKPGELENDLVALAAELQ